jgi:DNA-directed RNA polymerase subunit RPC12/RpoP
MKPKTKFQKEIVSLSSKLKPVSTKQKNWFHKRMPKFFTHSRKSLYCLECGAKWLTNSPDISVEKITCPVCNVKLIFKSSVLPRETVYQYDSILETAGEFQVVRMFFSSKFLKRKTTPRYHCIEVMQHFIDSSGKSETLSLKCNGLSRYNDDWIYTSGMEARISSSAHRHRATYGPTYIYPNRKIIPILKRNGFNGNFHGIYPQALFKSILSNNEMETLLKVKQIDLLRHSIFTGRITSKYWPAIRICIRNNYIVKDATMWLDYLEFLEYFKKDLQNPKFVCPQNLKRSHDLLLKKKKKAELLREKEERVRKLIADESEYLKQKQKFFNFLIRKKELTIRPLKSVEEFRSNGEILNHCVYTNNYFKKEDSLILSAEINDTPVETIEVSLNNFQIVQARGLNNRISPHHKEIVSLMKRNLHKLTQF